MQGQALKGSYKKSSSIERIFYETLHLVIHKPFNTKQKIIINHLNFCFMETMASYILSILKSNSVVLMSWGAHMFTPLVDDKGLSFVVNGFIYKGKVIIIYNEGSDLFDVYLGDNKYSEIYFDELVSFLDRKIEKDCGDEQYNKTVNTWLENEFNQE